MDFPELEAGVGRLWDRWARKATTWPRHPGAEVSLESLRGSLQVYFHAMGGAPAVRLTSSREANSGHRLSLRQRVGFGSSEALQTAILNPETLQLPPVVDLFPEAELNRELYFWLAAFLAHARMPALQPADPLQADLQSLALATRATERALHAWPGLAPLHRRLCAALLRLRPRRSLPPVETGVEESVLHCLGGPSPASEHGKAILAALRTGNASPFPAPRGYRPFLPVPLWGRVDDPGRRSGTADDEDSERGQSADMEDSGRLKASEGATDQAQRRDPLVLNRFEYLLSIAEMFNANRQVEDDEPESARRAAESLDELTLGEHGKRPASRLKMDLELAPREVDRSALHGTYTYPEWDYSSGSYLADHCCIQHQNADEEGSDWEPDALTSQRIRRIRRQFEALRPTHRIFPSEPDGDELDLNALIRSVADLRASGAGSDRIYLRSRNAARDFGVVVLLDASLSTDSWVENRRVLDVEKEAVLALSSALSACGDNHAVLAFSSRSRRKVSISTLRDFSEKQPGRFERRLQALTPGYYTRIGAALRHSTALLSKQPNRHRLILLLTDGKPNDVDHYEGRYGVEDTRRAVLEARRQGLTVFGITVDSKAREYFPYLFGPGGYAVVSRLSRLPVVLPQMYRQLTG